MKKQMMIFIVGFMVASSMNATYDSDIIAQKLSNAGSKAFGSFKMFDKAINESGLREWNTAIAQGTEIVLKKNKSSRAIAYVNRIKTANNNLTNTIKAAYNSMFLPFENVKKATFEDIQNNLSSQAKFVASFNRIKADMDSLIKEANTSKILQSSITEKDIIVELARAISGYADNAIASIDYKLSTESKFSMTRDYVR